MNEDSFLRERFRGFYSAHLLSEPPAVEKREFGIGDFGKKISVRHLSFSSPQEFNGFLRREAPFFVSYSAAYYAFPGERPMEAKHWQGADLVFEFDADDLKTDCKREHDSWSCPKCKASGKGAVHACTNCGSGTRVEEWVCPDCLKAVARQTVRLVELLESDLGFSKGLSINFSGSKGFHVHVRSPEAKALSPAGRIEVLDFLTGQDLDLETLGFSEKNRSLYCIPFVHAKGWQKRILQNLFSLLEKNDASSLAVAGNVSTRTAEKILQKKDSVVESIKNGFFPEGIGSKPRLFWHSVLEFVSDGLKLDIDRQTSLDKYKIVRVPETLHGSTGLKASNLEFSQLKTFNPLAECVVFSSSLLEIEVVSRVPCFFLKGAWFGPFEAQTLELPEFAAVFLLCRGAARLPEKAKK